MQKTLISVARHRNCKQRLHLCIIILTVVLLLTSCIDMGGIVMDIPPSSPGELPPFVISRPVFETTGRPAQFNFAGISFQFLNQGNEIVESITVSFLLFDARTLENPFLGSNRFLITRRETLFPNLVNDVFISLDRFIHVAPSEPFLIDFFYIYEIRYVDGTVWQDHHGRFRVRD